MPRKAKPILTWVIDTREQDPYRFGEPHRREFAAGGTLRYGLAEGDYAAELDAVLLPIRIERKSITDFFAVCGRERDRFAGLNGSGKYQAGPNTQKESELLRLKQFTSYLIIEADASQISAGIERSQVSGKAAICSALCWSVRFGITPIFAGSHRMGNAICQRLLEEFAVHFCRPGCAPSTPRNHW